MGRGTCRAPGTCGCWTHHGAGLGRHRAQLLADGATSAEQGNVHILEAARPRRRPHGRGLSPKSERGEQLVKSAVKTDPHALQAPIILQS
jgi:hypothetical protein